MSRTRASIASPAGEAAALVVLATMTATAMDATGKTMSQIYDPLIVVWFRYAAQAVLTVVLFAPSLPRRLRSKRPGLQMLRSALLAASTGFFFTAFALAPLADVNAVGLTAPLWITALAALFLGERVGVHRWSAVLVGFIGAMVVVRPGFETGLGWAAPLALGGALSFAGYSIATRAVGAVDDAWTSFAFTGIVGTIAASIAVPFVWTTPNLDHLAPLFAVGLFGAATQAAVILAFRRAEAASLAPVFYVQLLWAAIVGALVFGETPSLWTGLGALLIVSAGLYVARRERLRARADR